MAKSVYGDCPECGYPLEAVWFTEEEYKTTSFGSQYRTGRTRRAVKHGRWRKYSSDEWICTNCGYDKYCDTLDGGVLPPFCEECGCKMDLEDNNGKE